MAKQSKEELVEIKKQRDALLQLILNKTGVKYKALIEHAKTEYIINNLDVITPSEKQQFTKLIF
jgi:hypothetical protein